MEYNYGNSDGLQTVLDSGGGGPYTGTTMGYLNNSFLFTEIYKGYAPTEGIPQLTNLFNENRYHSATYSDTN